MGEIEMIMGRLGLVGLFGILIPGIYVLAMTIAAALGSAALFFQVPLSSVLGVYEKMTFVASAAFLLVSYLLGVLMRVFGPDRVDRMSTRYLSRLYFGIRKVSVEDRKSNPWIFEKFPYPKSLERELKGQGMSGVAELLKELNPSFGEGGGEGNTPFFNYCKLVVEGNCPDIGRILAREEAMVRFLSGSALALLYSSGLWFVFAFAALFVSMRYAAWSALLSCLILVFLIPILARFKFQRRREVLHVWTSIFLLCRGALPNACKLSAEEFRKAIRPS